MENQPTFIQRFAVLCFADGELDWIAIEDTKEAAETSAVKWAKNNPGAGMVAIAPLSVVFTSFIE